MNTSDNNLKAMLFYYLNANIIHIKYGSNLIFKHVRVLVDCLSVQNKVFTCLKHKFVKLILSVFN